MANPVNWFEIPVRDIDRAKGFYEFVLELKLERHDMGPMLMAWFPMENDAPGATGSLVQTAMQKPCADGIRVYFSTGDLDQTLNRAAQRGGHIVLPRTSIGEYGFIAVVQDTEGNRFGLHSMT